jgi:hypothetical protein
MSGDMEFLGVVSGVFLVFCVWKCLTMTEGEDE